MARDNDWEEVPLDDWEEVGGAKNDIVQAPQASNAPKAAMAGLAQGATLGYTPQIVGGIASYFGRGAGPVDPRTGERMDLTNYLEARDATNKELDALAKANSAAYYGANIGANLATAPLTLAKGAQGIKGAMLMGGAQGLLQNPGDVEGQLNPLQLEERAANAATGAAIGGIAGGIGRFAQKSAERSEDLARIKSGQMSSYAKAQIDDALEALNQKQIAPRNEKLVEYLKGKAVNIDPDQLTSLPDEAAALARSNMAITGGSGSIPVNAEKALGIKRQLDEMARYAKSNPFDQTAIPRGQTAALEAAPIRSQINAIPGVKQLNEEMGDIISKRNYLADRAKSAPISALKARPGTDRDSLVKTIDQLAGSKLGDLSERIRVAQDLQLDPTNYVKPLEAANELRKLGRRGLISIGSTLRNPLEPVASLASKMPAGQSLAGALRSVDKQIAPAAAELNPAALRALFEAKRRK